MNTDDSILLRRWVSERDADAFVQVAMRHAKMVYNVALRILGNPHDAEEVAQDCFEALASTTKPPKDNLSGWLYQVAANQAKNRVRSEQRRQEREEKFWVELPPIPDVSWDDVYQYVDEIILQLPDICREPLVAHFFEQETHQQIAQRLGIPRRTVTNHIQQGIETVRQGLKKRGIPVTAVAIGTWFEAQATAVTTLPAPLAAKIARIGLAGVGEGTVVTNSNVSLLGKLSVTKWLGGGIAATLLVGGFFFWGSKPPQTSEVVSIPSPQVIAEKQKASTTTMPVVDPPKTLETPPATATTPATTSIVEDPLASLWGLWSTQEKMGDQPPTQGLTVRIHQEGNNIVISDAGLGKEFELIGPIRGLQLAMTLKDNSSDQSVLSGTYTPNTDLFTLSRSFSNEGQSVSVVAIFTRLKGNAITAELRKTEVQAISSALEEYKKEFRG